MNYFIYFITLGSLCGTIVRRQSVPCTTPNGENATCVSLLSCPVLLEALTKDSVAKKFVEASACREGALMVCCGKSGNYTQELNKTQESLKPLNESSRDYVIRNKLLPSKKYCGMQHTDDYFYNKTETSVDEFPWLVRIESLQDYSAYYYSRKEFNCVGVLISNQHILTSYSDCISRHIYYDGGVYYRGKAIVLGQHHIYKDVSCIPTPYHVDDCTGPAIEKKDFAWWNSPSLTEHNLGILVLRNKIEYSDYLRPICLPLDSDDMPQPGDTVFTSGWGENILIEGEIVKLKKRIKHTVMDDEECKSGNPVQDPICGIPLENNTHNVCPGDNGGPLMYKHNNNWIVTGLVSKTVTCDEVHPVIAIRLTSKVIDILYDEFVANHKSFIQGL